MLIRAAIPADIPRMMSLAEQAETAAHWNAREYDALFSQDAPKRITLVILEAKDDEIIGFVMARCGDADWEIENVVVHPKYRRRGLGELLVRELLARARQGNALKILLEVRESNLPARQLYAKLGFSESGRRRAYYHGPREDAILLELGLQTSDNIP